MTVEIGSGSDDRGVSDVVGYVLIFSLIVATVGVVTVTGFSTLEDRQDAERVNNVERTFDVFANNMEDVYRGGAPSRATEMRLAGGELRYGEPTEITVRRSDDPNINRTARVTPLVYADGDTEIVYEAGAVVRSDGDGGVMLRRPPLQFGTERTLLPLVRTTRSTESTSVSLEDTIRVESARTSIDTDVPSGLADPSADLELEIDSERQEVWNRYLEETAQAEEDWSYDDGTLTFDTERASVPRFRIQLRFVR